MLKSHIDPNSNKYPAKTDEIQNLTEETTIQNLLDKTGEVLRAGGLSAEALTILIVGFHERLNEENRS